MNATDDSDSTGLREYALQIWARKALVVIVFLVVVGGTIGYCVITKAKYTGSAELLLTPTLSPVISAVSNQPYAQQTVDVPSDIQVIESAVVRSIVRSTIPTAPDASAAEITTTNVVQISTTSTDKNVAWQAADAYARAYIKFEQDQTVKTLTSGADLVQKHINTIHLAITGLTSSLTGASASTSNSIQAQLTSLNQETATLENVLANYEFYLTNGSGNESGQIISFAAIPSKPSSPKTVEYTVIGAIIGLLLGIGAAMLAEALSSDTSGPSTTTRTGTVRGNPAAGAGPAA
jgi:uncharacterized protein involved in exopolysaccharide biosynthesis